MNYAFVGIILLVVVSLCTSLMLIYYGISDVRNKKSILKNEIEKYTIEDGYYPFYSGVYIGGTDLEPGSYDVVILGWDMEGTVRSWQFSFDYRNNKKCYNTYNITRKTKGYHFNISYDEVISFDLSGSGVMRIKRIILNSD